MRNSQRASGKANAVSIVGTACRLPGGIVDLDGLVTTLGVGRSTVAEYPTDRRILAPEHACWAGQGAYLDRSTIAGFDADFFGIEAQEAVLLDPQQRLLLMLAVEALEDAGIAPRTLAGETVGCFVAQTDCEYADLVMEAPIRDDDSQRVLGVDVSMAPGRISNFLKLRGPSYVIDAACASSLAALHTATQQILSGDCDLAIVGATNLILSPRRENGLRTLGVLSTNGRCRSFAADGDGFGRGEAAIVIVLASPATVKVRRLGVLGRVLGGCVNHNGPAASTTAPNGPAQQSLLRRALRSAGTLPKEIGYIHAHATGSWLGDSIELNALAEIFCERPTDQGPVPVGASKRVFGHTEAASGLVSCLHVLASYRSGKIPGDLPEAFCEPKVEHSASRLKVGGEPQPWAAGPGHRKAIVSALGMNGTNAALVLCDPARPPAETRHIQQVSHLLVLSAKTLQTLDLSARGHQSALSRANASVDLGAYCHAAATRRDHHPVRATVVGASAAELVQTLGRMRPGQTPSGRSTQPILVFSGQGTQWPGMAAELHRCEPAFRETWDACANAAVRHNGPHLHALLAEYDDTGPLWRIEIAQPMVAALQIAQAALWQSWGVRPAGVVGYSVGEIAAAWTAGLIDLDTAMRIACCQAKTLRQAAGRGGMLAVELSEQETQAWLSPNATKLYIGGYNSPESTMVTGTNAALVDLAARMKAKGLSAYRLPLEYPFHSPLLDDLRDPLLDALGEVKVRSAGMRFYSATFKSPEQASTLGPEHWWITISQPVRFAPLMDRLLGDGYRVFLEVGPHPGLALPMMQCMARRRVQGTVLSSGRRQNGTPPDGRREMLRSLGRLYAMGFDPDWKSVFRLPCQPSMLPKHPWSLTESWVPVPAPVRRGCAKVRPAPATGPAAHTIYAEQGAAASSDVIDRFVRAEVAVAIGLDPDVPISTDTGFFSLGMTSAGAVRLKSALERRFGLKLQATFAFDYPTVASLTERIAELTATLSKDLGT